MLSKEDKEMFDSIKKRYDHLKKIDWKWNGESYVITEIYPTTNSTDIIANMLHDFKFLIDLIDKFTGKEQFVSPDISTLTSNMSKLSGEINSLKEKFVEVINERDDLKKLCEKQNMNNLFGRNISEFIK